MAIERQVERVFLGGEGPPIRVAADWLLDTLGGEGGALGEALVVVPGGQAQRRLMELLAERSAGRALLPPAVVTLGGMVDRLLPRGERAVADGLASLLAWSWVLREAEAGVIDPVLPERPGRDDWPGWWSLAGQVQKAADELGGHLIRVQDVAERLTDAADAERWAALGELAGRYEQRLGAQGLVDRHAARADAIAQGACEWPGPVVLLATADLQPVHERALACLETPVTALIAADEGDAEGFDGSGGLIAEYWSQRRIGLDEPSVVFADRPGDQALAVLRAIEGWSQQDADLSADRVTVGLGDESMSGEVARSLELAGVPARVARGRSMGGARPVGLLRAMAGFADGRRFDALAVLLRHPDAEQAVTQQTGESPRPWLTLLDEYATDHLAARPTAGWLGEPQRVEQMEKVYRAALSLLPTSPAQARPLNEWAQPIGAALSAVYGGRRLHRHGEDDRPIVATLDAIGQVLERLAGLGSAPQPACTFAQAVALLVDQLAGQSIPEPGGKPAVELVGYLELLLDDAPRLVITGMNEQHVPAPPTHSPLVSEGLRAELGLPDDTRRLARDSYALSAMLAWRSDVRLIAGRRSREGDPLLPSRLLLQADDATLAQRVRRFVDDDADEAASNRPGLLAPGPADRFLIPPPALPIEPITRLRVTAFRDYLACPYRFYLRHVLGLEAIDDRALELSAGGFGTLAHQALRELARDELRAVDDAEHIAERLSMALDHGFTKTYGSDPPVAARLQAEQLRTRLHALAPHHAAMVAGGWRVEHAEVPCEAEVVVDGQPFTITGTIDRIDMHPEHGYRLIDYKTANTPTRPDKAHRKNVEGEPAWVDLQLPLYLDLSAALRGGASAELGYIHLPKKPGETGYAQAEWDADELASAREVRDGVIKQLREQVFWPPVKDHRSAFDGLAGVCGDEVADRWALIEASGQAPPRAGEGGQR